MIHRSVLVTGGAGFIGSHLVRRLVADGYPVTVLDDGSAAGLGRLEDVAHSMTIRHGSILDPDALKAAIDGQDAVVHLAAVASAAAGDLPRAREVNLDWE